MMTIIIIIIVLSIIILICCAIWSLTLRYFERKKNTQETYLDLKNNILSILHISAPTDAQLVHDLPKEVFEAVDSELEGAMSRLTRKGLLLRRDNSINNDLIAMDRISQMDGQEMKTGGLVLASSLLSRFVMIWYHKNNDQGRMSMIMSLDEFMVVSSSTVEFICTSEGSVFMLQLVLHALQQHKKFPIRMINLSKMNGLFKTTKNVLSTAVVCAMIPAFQRVEDLLPFTHNYTILDYCSNNDAHSKTSLKKLIVMHAPYTGLTTVHASTISRTTPITLVRGRRVMELITTDILIVTKATEKDKLDTIRFLATTMPPLCLARTQHHARFMRASPPVEELLQHSAVVITEEVRNREEDELGPESTFGIFHEGKTRVIVARPPTLNGVPLRVGDRVTLFKRTRLNQNGTYNVVWTDTNEAVLVDDEEKNSARTSQQTMQTCVFGLERPGSGLGYAVDKQTCESSGGIWDSPCQSDADCPFFVQNVLHTSDSLTGGCSNSGYCELPQEISLDLKGVSYRTFNRRL